MKNQRTKSESLLRSIKCLCVLSMLAMLLCLCQVAAFADGTTGIQLNIPGVATYDAQTQEWYKNYDGVSTVADVTGMTITINGTAEAVTGITFDRTDVGTGFMTVAYAGGEIPFPARIDPCPLTWSGNATASVEYKANSTEYTIAKASVNTSVATLQGYAGGESGLTFALAGDLSFSASRMGDTDTTATVTVSDGGNAKASNYIVPALPVKVDITPIKLYGVEWENYKSNFTFGDPAALSLKAYGLGSSGERVVELIVKVKSGTELLSLGDAYAQKKYGYVIAGEASTAYTLIASEPNDMYVLDEANITEHNQVVKIDKKIYQVTMAGATYLSQWDLGDSSVTPLAYQLLVSGNDVPASFLEKFVTYEYTLNGAPVQTVNGGVIEAGDYTVKATLAPIVEDGFENWAFDQTELTASLVIKKNYLLVGTADETAKMIVLGSNGIPDSVRAEFSIPKSISRKAIYGYHVYDAYTLKLIGGANATYKVLIPISSKFAANKNCEALTINDLYLYDGVSSMAPASEKYTVSLSANGAYYTVEGFTTDVAVTFIVAPGYDAPFWVSAPGIALIILILLVVLLILFIVGLKLRQIERSDANNKILTIDTEGDIPAFEPIIIPDTIDDPDAVLAESIDDMAEILYEDIDAEVNESEVDADATEAVEESLGELMEEVDAIDLTEIEAEELADIDALTDAMAEEKAKELEETVDAEDGTADIDNEVSAAVAEALAENFNDSADATDAIALVEEPVEDEIEEIEDVETAEEVVSADEDEDGDNDNDDDDEDSSFAGFGSMPLSFIDAVAEAEKYNEMLEQERAGEVQLVVRYRRSYLSRLAQSQGSVQDYYNLIKNLLLSYKGIKNRISWNYESFNLGRRQVAKFNAKTRTLYLYLAIEPETLAETKYTFADMSSKKKYAAVPVLMKIKGDRKFKHAMELVTMLCETTLGLAKKKVVEEVDYKLPYMTTEKLVEEGMVKKMVAAIPLTAPEAIEEAPVGETEIAADAPVESDEAENI